MSTLKTCLDETGLQICVELYRAIESITPDPGLLAVVGSWGDTMDDEDILDMLKSWNEMGEPFAPDTAVRYDKK